MREGANENYVVLKTFGDDALVFRPDAKYQPFVVAHGYDETTKSWSHGSYHSSAADAWNEVNPEIVEDLCITTEREDVRECLAAWNFDQSERNIDDVLGSDTLKRFTKQVAEDNIREDIHHAIEELQDDLERPEKDDHEPARQEPSRTQAKPARNGIEER